MIGLKVAAEQCFDCVRPGGTATIIGMIPVGQKIELDGPMFLHTVIVDGRVVVDAYHQTFVDAPRL